VKTDAARGDLTLGGHADLVHRQEAAVVFVGDIIGRPIAVWKNFAR
jgi:hypothetical protein